MVAAEQPHVHYGQIIATNVSEAEYLEQYAAQYCEWVNGVVIKMSPASLRHNFLIDYLTDLLRIYFTLNPIGRLVSSPFVMSLSALSVKREPDLQIVLNANPHELTDTAMNGPADICIEIVSPESVERDRGEKFSDYERGGVREYWIIDPLRNEPLFYRLNDDGVYIPQKIEEGQYRTPLLPQFVLNVATLWAEELPNPLAVVSAVQAMLSHES
jgi:Uma2 family endonuclease